MYSKNTLRHQLQFGFELLRLFSHHPTVLVRYLVQSFFPTEYSSIPADILFFSNGLHLASYHSLLPALQQHKKLHVITDRQSPLDAFYLHQYNLHLQSLPQLNIAKKTSYAKKIINQVKPKLVITTHDPSPSAMAFVSAAKAKKITTLVLMHGIPSEGWYFFSDHHIVWGPKIKRFAIDQGMPPKKVISGGQPIFYDYQQYFKHHRKKTTNRPQVGVILSGYGANQPHQVKYVQSLLQKLRQMSVRITIRTHPGQYIDNITPATLNLGQTIEELVAQSDIIITQTSTAAVIAALSNTPVIYFPAFHPQISQGVLWKYRAFSPVTSAATCSKKAQQLLNSKTLEKNYLKKQHQQVLEYTGPINANIGSDLAKKIMKLL